MVIIRELFFFGPSVSAVRTEFLALGTNHSEGSESNDKQDVRGRNMSGVMLITRDRGEREGRGMNSGSAAHNFRRFVLIMVAWLTNKF